MKRADNIKKFFDKAAVNTNPQMDKVVLDKVLATQHKKHPAQSKPVLWRLIMKNNITKFAAATVLIVAVTIGILHLGGGTVTWAAVIEPIFNAQTASLDITFGTQANQAVIHDQIMGSRIRRTVSGFESQPVIIDFEQMQMLTLDQDNKTATTIKLDGLGDIQNYVDVLRDLILRLQTEPDFMVDNLGLQELNGKNCIVFAATAGNQTITIWADPKTALPVRIEQITPNMQIVCENLLFDITLEESLFSMEVPEGYTKQDSGIDFASNSEADFIETLRIWAEIIEDGVFPDSINLEDVVSIGPKFDRGLERANLSEQEQLEVATRWGQGYVFIRFFKGQGQWHYAGTGVKLGDAETPIFWYQPQNSETWRVIYGDLSVRDEIPENLPNPALSDRQVKIIESSEQLEQMKFMGTQKDTWHITASGEAVIFSDITLTKVSQDENAIYIKLPYSFATLETVKSDNEEISFNQVTEERYDLELPVENLLEGLTTIECMWSVPLEALEIGQYGYEMKVQSLIPAERYELYSVLQPDCGFQYTRNPSLTEMTHYTGGAVSVTGTGTCGLSIEKIE